MRSFGLVSALVTALSPRLAWAERFDVDAWLAAPGVRLVAVDFFSTACGACVEAAPRWQALQQRYRDRGLRVVVVAAWDAKSGCARPLGWEPDLELCDQGGGLAARLGFSALPAASLWSWRGSLLASHAGLPDLEARMEAWLAAAPRVLVEGPSDLVGLVGAALERQGKLPLVRGEGERRRFEASRKDLALERAEQTPCAPGEELSPHLLLQVARAGGKLSLSLLSVELACRVATVVDWRERAAEVLVSDAVSVLLNGLRRDVGQAGRWPTGHADSERSGGRANAGNRGSPGHAWAEVQAAAELEELPVGRRLELLRSFLQGEPPEQGEARRLLAEVKRGLGTTAAIPAGDFFMGCDAEEDPECGRDEMPRRTVRLQAFRIDRTEVTVAAFQRCVDAGRCSGQGLGTPSADGVERRAAAERCNWGRAGREAHPINCVDWHQADRFCRFARKRLPSETEWERAGRGADGRKYPWGNIGFPHAGRVANIGDESAKRVFPDWETTRGYDDGYSGTAPVGSFPAGRAAEGALDLIGNVWEWTSTRDGTGKYRQARGGAWDVSPRHARASYRVLVEPGRRSEFIGFRCVQ